MADQITVTVPPKHEFASSLRLFLSGLASSMDFPVDEIEDIRACVSEACLLLLNGQKCRQLELVIEPDESKNILRVKVLALDVAPDPDVAFEDFSEEISRLMIEALSSECVFAENDGLLCEVGFTKRKAAPAEGAQ